VISNKKLAAWSFEGETLKINNCSCTPVALLL
jgi:hypothetical protein